MQAKQTAPLTKNMSIMGYSGSTLDRIAQACVFAGTVSPSKLQSNNAAERERLLKGQKTKGISKSKALNNIRMPLRVFAAKQTRQGMAGLDSALDARLNQMLKAKFDELGAPIPQFDLNWLDIVASTGVHPSILVMDTDPADVVIAKEQARSLLNNIRAQTI
jgi:hypothetical protein